MANTKNKVGILRLVAEVAKLKAAVKSLKASSGAASGPVFWNYMRFAQATPFLVDAKNSGKRIKIKFQHPNSHKYYTLHGIIDRGPMDLDTHGQPIAPIVASGTNAFEEIHGTYKVMKFALWTLRADGDLEFLYDAVSNQYPDKVTPREIYIEGINV